MHKYGYFPIEICMAFDSDLIYLAIINLGNISIQVRRSKNYFIQKIYSECTWYKFSILVKLSIQADKKKKNLRPHASCILGHISDVYS